MSDYVRIAADTPLTEEDKAQLRALAERADAAINYANIPELSDVELAAFLPWHQQPGQLGSVTVPGLKKAS